MFLTAPVLLHKWHYPGASRRGGQGKHAFSKGTLTLEGLLESLQRASLGCSSTVLLGHWAAAWAWVSRAGRILSLLFRS